ncbi:MAG: ABC transporter substrate-binding protein, partial [Chloroflexi bacterium]|nr:ABC transporter substrate-binding protein [Chloroflexota bacterium]
LPNCQKEPTSDKLVRQALNYALDRQRITDSIWQGLAKPEALPWSSSSPAYDASKNTAYAFDLEKAQALLNQAGVSNLAFDISWTTAVPDYAKAAQIYQADLAKLGITTTLKPLEGPVYFAALQGLTYTGLMFSGGLNGHLAPGSMILGPFYGPTVNNSGFTDDGYTQLANAVLTAVDPDKQNVLYAQLNDYYLDQSWVMPISQNPPHMIARTSVQGLRYDGREALLLQDVSIAA